MTPDEVLEMAARKVLASAERAACFHALPEDRAAMTTAILCRAAQLSAPDISPDGLAALMVDDD